jgi:murein DD-endopeptidase MepM/ murein hydrolase activator NlpD
MSLRTFRILLTLAIAGMLGRELWQRLGGAAESLSPQQQQQVPFDPAFIQLSAREQAELPLAIQWDMPMGSELGALTYNAQPFRITRHLGDDLNGIGGYHSDLGDPVWAAASGIVVYCGMAGPGWGKMVILASRVPTEDGRTEVMQAVYAHLQHMEVIPGQRIQRGERIGSVGTAEGRYWAHLHFELRRGTSVNPGIGYADATLNRLSPEAYIASRRPRESEK